MFVRSPTDQARKFRRIFCKIRPGRPYVHATTIMQAGLGFDERREDWRTVSDNCSPADSSLCVLNLSRWISGPTLLRWIEEEINQALRLNTVQLLRASDQANRFKSMLRLLCFAYANGLARSSEIIKACHDEPDFREVAAGLCPFVDEIRGFRRRHREVLERVLTRIFMRAAVWDSDFGREALRQELETHFGNRIRSVLNMARHLDACDD